MLRHVDDDNESQDSPRAPSISYSKAGSLVSRTAQSMLGFSPINMEILKRSAEFVKRWLNFNCLTHKIHMFP